MAEIYAKSGENTLILEPREYMLRQFNFGDWTELRMGMYFGCISAASANANVASESVTLVSAVDRLCFGIKDSSTSYIPGQVGASFLGITTMSPTGNGTAIGTGSLRSIGGNNFAVVGLTDGTATGGTTTQVCVGMDFPSDVTGATAYNGFVALKFVVANLGLSSQTVTISGVSTNSISGSDYSATALRALLNGATYTNPSTIAWNTGAAAKDIPNCWFLRLPFLNNRIRISCIDMMKIA